MAEDGRSTYLWRKSSWSGGSEGACVEVAMNSNDDTVLLRDSVDPGGPYLEFSRANWFRFLRMAKHGGCDRPGR